MAKKNILVAGVDGCRDGWLVGIFSVKKDKCQLESLTIAKDFKAMVEDTKTCKAVCVDIPIGLSTDEKPRKCDVEAQRILKARGRSIFPAPVRQCLGIKDFAKVCEVSLKVSGKKLSRQMFFIMDKIQQANEVMTPALQKRIHEIHPEVSLWAFNGGKYMQFKKQRGIGREERLNVLSRQFPNFTDKVLKSVKPRGAAPDDVVDVLAAAWTSAAELVRGNTRTVPEKPEVDSKGLRMEIICPEVQN